jgi:hypothetical protein
MRIDELGRWRLDGITTRTVEYTPDLTGDDVALLLTMTPSPP